MKLYWQHLRNWMFDMQEGKQPIRNLRVLLLGRVLAGLSANMFAFALSLYILDKTGSVGQFSLVLGFSIIPGVIINLLGGAFVDRNNKKKQLIYADLLSCFLMLVLGLLFVTTELSLIYLIAFTVLINVTQSFYGLAMSAGMPEMFDSAEISKANSLLQVSAMMISIVGPVAGAFAYKLVGITSVIFFNVVSIFGSSMLAILLRFRTHTKTGLRTSYLADIKEAGQYLKQEKVMRFLLMVCLIMNMMYVPMILLVMPYINYQVIKISGIQLSIIEAAWAIGGVFGGLYISMQKNTNRFIRNLFPLIIIQSLMLMCWVFPSFGFTGSTKNLVTAIFTCILALTGLVNMIQMLPLITHFQVKIPEKLRGKVMGVINATTMVSAPLGMWLIGGIMSVFAWEYIILGTGGLLILLALFFSRNRSFMAFTEDLKI